MAATQVTNDATPPTAYPPAPPAKRSTKTRAATAKTKTTPEEDDPEFGITSTITSPNGSDEADFWMWLSGYSDDDWQRMIAYMWRVEPITDKRTGGRPTHVEKIGRPFDVEYVMTKHGSGIYRVDVCQIEPTGNKQKRIRQHYFSILNLDYPPRVPPGDWIDDPANAKWKWAEAKIKGMYDGAPANGPQAGGFAANPAELFNTVLGGIRTLRGEMSDNKDLASSVIELVRDSRDQMAMLSDPTRQLSMIQQLITMVQPKEQGKSSDMLVIELLREDLRETRKELREMRSAQQQQPQRSLLEQVEEAKALFKVMNPGSGAAAASNDIWPTVINTAVEKLAPVLPSLFAWLTQGNGASQQQPQPQAGAMTPPNIHRQAPQPASPGAPAAAPPATSPQPVTSEGVQPTQQEMEQERNYMQQVLMTHGATIQKAVPFLIDHFQSGLGGYEFRDWFISREGVIKWNQLKNDCGAERLCALALSNEQLAQALQPPERLLAFLKCFFTPQGEEPEGSKIESDDDPDEDENETDDPEEN
jgi:TolA-binding protein